VSSATASARLAFAAGELRKVPAFARRDFLTAWSYRASFLSDAVGMVLQVVVFYFVGLMVDPSVLPSYGGSRVTYMEFVAVGIALGVFLQLGLGRVAAAVRTEQLTGTLEAMLMTPTGTSTIQLGSVMYDLIYIPVRTGLFLVLVGATLGLDFELAALPPAALILIVFIPFVWGLGVAAAAGTLTFKYGSGGVGLAVTLLTLVSAAYFPLHLFPDWLEGLATVNPLTVAIEGMRETLLGGAGWSEAVRGTLILLPFSIVSLVGGMAAFRLALHRERRRGSLALY
jgi:ABC-2 type transport system permease protein